MADGNLQEIKDKVDIVDLVGSYVKLKKAGTNFRGLCPFHHEKSGSFMVSPQKQIFHCFGCGEGGDIFEFIIKIENVDFREALKILADKAGIKLTEYKKKDKVVEEKEDLAFRINAFASQYYHKVLFSPAANFALEYVQGRGLSKETIEKWQIGFAPDDFHSLERALMQKNIRTLDMLEAGVSVKNDSGKVFDRFRNRITFPIYNYVGECVGFTARVLPSGSSDTQAKYINSPETRIYNKSKVLFGLNFAKLEIRKKDYSIVVEGQMDCIKAHQAGFTNCVATSGTALTQDQLVMLKKLSSNIIFCFDSDEAGEKALRRAVEIALPLGLSVKIMRLVGAKDPDELISDSPDKFKSAIKESLWALEYYILKAKKDFEYQSIEQKKFVKANILPLIDMFTDRLEQEHYMDKVVVEFGMTKNALLEIIKTKEMTEKGEAVVSKESGDEQERLILGGIIEIPQFREQIQEELESSDFTDPKVKEFIDVFKMGSEGGTRLEGILSEPFAKEAAFMVELRLQELQQNKEAVAGELFRSFHLLRLNAVKRKLTDLVSALKRAEAQKDPVSVSKLSQEYQHLIAERLRLEKMYNL